MIQKRSIKKFMIYLFVLMSLTVFWLINHNGSNNVSPLTWLRTHQEVVATDFANQANEYLIEQEFHMPLILQTDERWYYEPYGDEIKDNFMGINGCAIASLAMVGSYWQNRYIEPVEIARWADKNYYLREQGTTWDIFSEYANAIGMQAHDLANNFEAVKYYLNLGYPVIISVKPGFFTEVGHIMVLAQSLEGDIVVYDPNDSPEKFHYREIFSEELFQQESLNYWVFKYS